MLWYCRIVVLLLYMHGNRPAGCRDAAAAASPAAPCSSLGRQRPSPPCVVVVVAVPAATA